MCDALGTIIVDHLSKGELSGNPVRIVSERLNLALTLFYPFFASTGGGRAARTSGAPPRERINSQQLINESTPPSNPFSVEKLSFGKFARTHRKLSKSSSLPARSFREDKKKIIVNTYKQPEIARLSQRRSVDDKKNQFGKLFLSSLITNPSKNNYFNLLFLYFNDRREFMQFDYKVKVSLILLFRVE